MSTLPDQWYSFCTELHQSLAAGLSDVKALTAKAHSLEQQNSFRESCFCKGCVLPIVDTVVTEYMMKSFRASKFDVFKALRCEGFQTPLYSCSETQVGFSGHSRSNSYHPGDKSGRRDRSRRSPDFCIRYGEKLRMVGELKYLPKAGANQTSQVVHELRDYLAIRGEPTSDWGHDFGYGLIYDYSGDLSRVVDVVDDYWQSDRIFISRFLTP